jgi:hypothetical protein
MRTTVLWVCLFVLASGVVHATGNVDISADSILLTRSGGQWQVQAQSSAFVTGGVPAFTYTITVRQLRAGQEIAVLAQETVQNEGSGSSTCATSTCGSNACSGTCPIDQSCRLDFADCPQVPGQTFHKCGCDKTHLGAKAAALQLLSGDTLGVSITPGEGVVDFRQSNDSFSMTVSF